MSKVFTITDGLENMGAMKTGGQGSVYKGRRTGEIITAIKLLPTPIINPGPDDKNYKDFLNEVDKLKRVNEELHPNVVTILSSGVSDTGNFPFIEMEYIEGPDLEELLKPPHDPVFLVKDVCKVADHVSNAIAHCHKYNVKHGDIKSNNIKFNTKTGNYMLLDFGLSVMSDEQRRTSLRRAGAIEFMAPEQNEGDILFETDVYSLGVILFELIAGRVPFPLNDRTESARNTVRLSHMETPVPDMMQLRMEHLPNSWTDEQKEREMHLPSWLIDTVYKCLEKDPQDRFRDGVQLHDHIVHERHASGKNEEVLVSQVAVMKKVNKQLQEEVVQLKKAISKYENNEQAPIAAAAITTPHSYSAESTIDSSRSVSKKTFLVVLVLAIAFAAIAAYSFFGRSSENSIANSYEVGNDSTDTLAPNTEAFVENQNTTTETQESQTPITETATITDKPAEAAPAKDTATAQVADTSKNKENVNEEKQPQNDKPAGVGTRYRVANKAYFYSKADENTRRNEFIIPTGNVIIKAVEDKGDFILVNFKDDQGETTTGWVRKSDLNKLN